MIDLHIHSTFSDGTYPPEELVARAEEKGLTAMALTDHDTTKGVASFLSAIEDSNMIGVPGVEISANVDKGTMHVLGYFVDHESEVLEENLIQIRNGREIRNDVMIKNLNDMGFAVTKEEIQSYAGEDVIGRPHFAMAMLKKGYVKNTKEVFDKYLAKGKPAYADRFRMSPEASVKAILDAGGIPVLSHPFTLDLGNKELRQFVGELVDMGLQGLEVYYSEHSRDRIERYLKMTEEFGILATGGSDFHGDVNPKVNIGTGFGDLCVPDEVMDKMLEYIEGRMADVKDGAGV